MKLSELFESAPPIHRVIDFLHSSDKPNILSDSDAAKDFKRMSDAQRHGGAERAMLKIQGYLYNEYPSTGRLDNPHKAYATHIEHIGDLTHRLGEWVKNINSSTSDEEKVKYVHSGIEFCIPKIKSAVDGAFFRNWNITQKDLLTHVPNLKSLMSEYTRAHQSIPVFNKVQYHAREAAVALGKTDLAEAHHHLNTLHHMIRNKTAYIEACFYEKGKYR